MFLNNLKDFFAKKSVKKLLPNVKHKYSEGYIKTIGVVIDETEGLKKQNLLDLLIKNNFENHNVTVLRFKKALDVTEKSSPELFFYNDIDWFGNFNKPTVAKFVEEPFDLLINYFEKEKAPLMKVALESNALFKVGFQSVDNRLNQFIIGTQPTNYTIFVTELLKYLKILNKI